MNLLVPENSEVRPALGRMKNSLFNILMGMFDDKEVLDLFAGTGGLGLEALSRGAKSCLLVENNRECFETIQKNIAKIKAEKTAQAIFMDSFDIIDYSLKHKLSFDIIFVDPPYKYYDEPSSNEKLLKIIEDFAAKKILNKGGIIIVEHRFTETTDELSKLPHLKRIDLRNYGQTTLAFLAARPAHK